MTFFKTLAAAFMLLGTAQAAFATRIDSIARLEGDSQRELTGVGIVVGLKGTGDGGDFTPAMRPLQAMLTRFNDPVLLAKELKSANNVAVVTVTAVVPAVGAHADDKIDVRVSALAAKSLKGGRLIISPMFGLPRVDAAGNVEKGPGPLWAFASGELNIEDDNHQTQAVIHGGAVLAVTFESEVITKDNTFQLNINSNKASFGTAAAVADQINEDVAPQTGGKAVAVAVNATTVEVQIPKAEADRPAQFIGRIMALPLPKLPGTAKISINSKTKTIVVTGDVELAPALINQAGVGGLTITTAAPGAAGNGNGGQPAGGAGFVLLDPHKQATPKLKDLMDAFNVLKVSPDDRIAIIRQLYKSGALDCQLEIDQ